MGKITTKITLACDKKIPPNRMGVPKTCRFFLALWAFDPQCFWPGKRTNIWIQMFDPQANKAVPGEHWVPVKPCNHYALLVLPH